MIELGKIVPAGLLAEVSKPHQALGGTEERGKVGGRSPGLETEHIARSWDGKRVPSKVAMRKM